MMETSRAEIVHLLKKTTSKIKNAFDIGARNDEERIETRALMIEEFANAQRYVYLLRGGPKTKFADARISTALDELTHWNPERYMDGALVTDIPKALAALAELTGRADASLLAPKKSFFERVLSRVLQLLGG